MNNPSHQSRPDMGGDGPRYAYLVFLWGWCSFLFLSSRQMCESALYPRDWGRIDTQRQRKAYTLDSKGVASYNSNFLLQALV
jgi:hypothetical protein